MTIRQIQNHFFNELTAFYSKNELASLWNLCLDFVLKLKRTVSITDPGYEPGEEMVLKLKEVIRRLKKHEPIQYITQRSWFCDMVFNVNPAVLIPRPETEELVYRVCECIDERPANILDIGTGSGCIAISIKKIKPKSSVTAVDISEEALNTASCNAVQLLGDTSVIFLNRNVLKPDFADVFNVKFDIIVSNPPYIPFEEKESISENVLNFEPHLALFCGEDPMQFYKAIALRAKQLLKPGGLLFFELHENFGREVEQFLIKENFVETGLIKDMHGKNRIIKTRYPYDKTTE